MSRINTNIPSILASRIFNRNSTDLNTAMERLSTGLRINTGADDPAGLIASEKLRSEITAINAGIENIQRADDMVAVAEGALHEVGSLLLSLEDLVDRTANEAALSDEEVAANQLEIDSILASINRIASSTEFAGKKLLDGSLDYATSGVTTGAGASSIADLKINGARIPNDGYRTVNVTVTTSAQTAEVVYAGASIGSSGATIQVTGQFGAEQLSFASGTTAAQVAAAVNQSTSLTGISATVSGTGGNTRILFNSTEYGSDAFVTVEALQGTFGVTGGDSSTGDHGVDVGLLVNGVQAVSDGLLASINTGALSMEMTLDDAFATQTSNTKTFYITGGGADFSIGATVGMTSLASLGLTNVSTGSLGNGSLGYLSTLGSGQTNQLTSGNFETSQRIIREASTQIASLRGRLGSFQQHTLGSSRRALEIALENTSAAESAIRDADFAEETSRLTRSQILVNSSAFALQLANQAPQNVLSLLG